jgi:GNAT superfamily N-acetyltransferase
MYSRLRGQEFEHGKGAANRRAFRRIVMAGQQPGILAYAGEEPVGWCAAAPREVYPRIVHARQLQPVDDRPVWSVVCFFIARPWRRHGLTSRLLEAAAKFARARGATMLEGYPVVPRSRTSPDVFAWYGLESSFLAAGFREVARPSPSRRIMRLEFGRSRPRSGRG